MSDNILNLLFRLDKFPSRHLFAPSPPGVLYHYTTLNGSVGIINSKALWLTRIQHLNDSRELLHAIQLAGPTFVKFKTNASARRGIVALGNLVEKLPGAQRINMFVGSFCQNGDLLSQWRGYASNTQGIALGFSTRSIVQHTKKLGWHLFKCVYDQRAQERIVQEVFDAYLDAFDQNGNEAELASMFNAQFLTLAPILKDHAFAEEQEWRIITTPIMLRDPINDARVLGNRLVPYVPLQFERNFEHRYDFLATVNVGPSATQLLTVDAMSVLLTKHEVGSSASVSHVPYRI